MCCLKRQTPDRASLSRQIWIYMREFTSHLAWPTFIYHVSMCGFISRQSALITWHSAFNGAVNPKDPLASSVAQPNVLMKVNKEIYIACIVTLCQHLPRTQESIRLLCHLTVSICWLTSSVPWSKALDQMCALVSKHNTERLLIAWSIYWWCSTAHSWAKQSRNLKTTKLKGTPARKLYYSNSHYLMKP